MRRLGATCLACLVAFGIPTGARAQSIGFKLGGSLATQELEPDANRNSLGGFVGGGFVRFGISGMGVQLEVLALTKGSEAVENSAERKIGYVEVPLLLHVPLPIGASFAPYVILGPSLAFDIDCEEVGGLTNECPERETIDVGVNAGGGLGVAAGPGALLLEGRYNWGLKNISEDPALDVKNRSALFVIGYELPLGRR